MKMFITLFVFALLFTFTLMATAATKLSKLGPNSMIRTSSGHVIAVFDEGVVVKVPKLGSNETDCLSFCEEVCDTGQVDTCFCGAQSFPCEDLGGLPPVCKQ